MHNWVPLKLKSHLDSRNYFSKGGNIANTKSNQKCANIFFGVRVFFFS